MKIYKPFRHFFTVGLFLIPLLTSVNVGYSQCNCESRTKDNISIVACPPSPVASDNSTQVGLNMMTLDGIYRLGVTVRFKSSAIEISGNITLWLNDGNGIELEYNNGGLAYIGNSQVAQGVFVIEADDLSKIKLSKLKSFSFKLTDGLKRVYTVSNNSSVLIDQINCLK